MEPITTSEELAAVCERMAKHRYVTVDTEFLRETTYYPLLCVAQMATDSTTVKTNFTFSFPKAFDSLPNVLVSARSSTDVDDTFAVTVRRVTTTTCTVNVTRTDTAAGWGQHMEVTWFAWE